jgi:hypothetical protein
LHGARAPRNLGLVLLLLTGAKPRRTRKAAPARPRRPLVCSACERAITDEEHAVERGGAHAHTFVNPHGIVHEVRCFARATGVTATSGMETAFTWFPGYAWQILDCRGCGGHLGWRFRCGGDAFYGLVAGRLKPG